MPWLRSEPVGPPGSTGLASLTDQGLALHRSNPDLPRGSRAPSTAMAPPIMNGGARGLGRPSGARKGSHLALIAASSRRTQVTVRRPSAAVGSLIMTLILMAGCGDDSRPNVSATPGQASTSTTSARSSSTVATNSTTTVTASTLGTPATEADIAARYKEFWQARAEANRDPVNPSDPRLAQLATGKQLDNVVTETRQRLEQGVAFRYPVPSVSTNRVRVVEVVGDSATLRDCATNDGIVYRVADGQVLDDSVVTRSVVATMLRVDGVWRLAEARVVQEWTGVAGCAQSPDFS